MCEEIIDSIHNLNLLDAELPPINIFSINNNTNTILQGLRLLRKYTLSANRHLPYEYLTIILGLSYKNEYKIYLLEVCVLN